MDRHSLRIRVALIVATAVVVSLAGFAAYLSSEIRSINEREETAKLQNTNQLIVNMIAQTDGELRQQAELGAQAFRSATAGEYSLLPGEPPLLRLNGTALNGSTREVDAFSGSGSGNIATLFVRQGDDFLRIATSLKKEDGSRAVGTRLDRGHPAYAGLLEGRPFTGKATLFGRYYMTRYEPIRDAKGQVIGVHFVGIDIVKSLDKVRQTIKQVKLGQTGYVYVLDAAPGPGAGTLLIHPAQEGRNIADARDNDGKLFIREMLEKRNGIITYPWFNKEAGDTRPRDKIVAFNDYKDWNWIVASGSYTEEIFSLVGRVRDTIFVACAVLVVVLLAILSFTLNRLVITPLHALVLGSRRIAEGDLAVRIDAGGRDEVGQVTTAMAQMVAKLSGIIGEVRAVADSITGAAQQLSTTTTEVGAASERQAQATAASAAALEEVTVSINEVSKLARATEESSKRTATLTRDSVAAIGRAVAEIDAMAQSIAAASEQVGGLVKRSEEVGSIAGVIREIADQTNLLALNAAIEAARAGEQGRGFAVVADEVRKLAERTAKATREIAEVIEQIQQETRQTVLGMEAATPKIRSGLDQVNEVSAMLDRIAGEAAESQTRAVEVADATREQAIAANDIARNVEQVAQMTEATNATMRGNVDSAQQLQAMAGQLRQQVAYFRTA